MGLAYLAFVWPAATFAATIVLFNFGALGVLPGIRRGPEIACPGMGTILSMPLSAVTLAEDLAMVAMAAPMLTG